MSSVPFDISLLQSAIAVICWCSHPRPSTSPPSLNDFPSKLHICRLSVPPSPELKRPHPYFGTPATPSGVHSSSPHSELIRSHLCFGTSNITCLRFLGAQMNPPLPSNRRPKFGLKKHLCTVLSSMLCFPWQFRVPRNLIMHSNSKTTVKRVSWLLQLIKVASAAALRNFRPALSEYDSA